MGCTAFGSLATAFCAIVLWFLSSVTVVMPPKQAYPWKQSYIDEFELKVASINEHSRRVDTAICQFCQTFGREVDAIVCKQAEMKAFQFFKKDSFDYNNIKKTHAATAASEVVGEVHLDQE